MDRSYQINAVASSNQLDQGIPWTRNAGLLIRCINTTPAVKQSQFAL